MEILPKPLGIMTSTVNYLDANKYGSVALGGIAAGFSGLTPGMTYYATTSGKVITDGSLYGRSSATASNSANNGHFYVTDVVDKLIVSSDSIIGIAVASDSILLRSV